jgi:CRISPR-associated protein Cmr4
MGEQARIYFIHALSPLHAGIGEGLDSVNLPTARERATGYPFLPGSSIKGVLREIAEETYGKRDERVVTAFGPPTENAADARGGLVFSDASLLALPVRSHYGTFAWVTCPYVLRRLTRDVAEAGRDVDADVKNDLAGLRDALGGDSPDAHYPESGSVIRAGTGATSVYLEDLRLSATPHAGLGRAAHWLADLLWPSPAGSSDRAKAAGAAAASAQRFFEQRTLLVKDDHFARLSRTATELRHRVKIDHDTGTAAASGPWTEEHLPAETLLHGLVLGRRTRYFAGGRKPDDSGRLPPGVAKSDAQSLDALKDLVEPGTRLRFGGKSTAGMGRARLQIAWPPTKETVR